MSNPYLNFLASLGGPTGSHSTLKKLASTSASTNTTATTATATVSTHRLPSSSSSSSSSSSPNASTALPRLSSTNKSFSSSNSTRPHSSSSKPRPSAATSTYSNGNSSTSHSKSSSNSHSSSTRNYDGADSRNYSNGHDRPYSNDKSSRSHGSRSYDNSHRRDTRDRGYIDSSMKNDRKRDRDGDTRYSRDSSRFATKDSSSYSESRARKRHARSRSRSRSRNRSRSRSMPRSPSRSRDRTPSRSRIRSRSRTPVPTRQRLLTPPPPPRTPSPAPRTPSPAPRIPPHQMQSTYPDIDDASSFSTLSSPASFSPSLSPRSMPPSPIKELSPIKRRRMENIAQAEASYSSPSSLSSLSPDRRNHASPERGSRPSDLDISPYPSTPSEAEIAAQNQTNGTVHHLTKAPASQHSLELELFGVADGDKGRGGSKNRNGTNKKQENGVASKTTPAIKSNGEDNEEEYASLGSLATELKGNGLSTKNSNSHAGNHQMRRHSIKALKGTREIITINTKKGTVTSAVVPISPKPKSIQKNGHRPSKSISSSKESKEDSQKLTNSTTNGSGARRMSILHSDQIVAAAMNRYKNHFHMLVEDSDSTVASNPSSTGADTMHVALEYPGKDAREKFTLMKPFLSRSKTESDDKDEYNPIEDLVQTVRIILEHFFTPERSKELFGSSNEGIHRNLTKFKVRKDGAQFLKVVEDFNQIMKREKASGAVQGHVKQYGHRLPYDLVVHILQQVYSRTVAARAAKLNQYEAFSNNVYGEILPILTKEFIQRTKLDQSKVFVDLGCGIGNVVLQVALQTGAESYGVEIMETPAKFSKKQAKEFEARSRAYGLHHGPVSMIQGDFLDTPGLPGILARADVVLVNNYAFNSALNQSLLQLFLDLKEGCKIISLKTFVSLDHKINVRNAGSVESILRVKKYPYYTNAVSWTHNGGEYFIATVDRSAVQAFWERAMANGGASLDDSGGRRSSTRRR